MNKNYLVKFIVTTILLLCFTQIALGATEQDRHDFAREAECAYLDNGMDVYVKAVGNQSQILSMKWILMSRPIVYKFINNKELIADLRKRGFKKIEFTNGYDYNTSWILDK